MRCGVGRSTRSHLTYGDPFTRPRGVGVVVIALHRGAMLAAESVDVTHFMLRELIKLNDVDAGM